MWSPVLIAVAVLCLVACWRGSRAVVVAQSSAPPAAARNLKVLPKDISSIQLNRLMLEYQSGLGVPCGYCHTEVEGGTSDYASDENPIKQTARIMIGMTREINEKYLSQVGDRRYAQPITCGNCHQGLPQPPTFVPRGR